MRGNAAITGGQAITTAPIEQLRRLARERPGAAAFTERARTIDFAELFGRCTAVAQGLIAHGVRRGERVAYLGRNSVTSFEVIFGCALSGAVMAPMNWRLTAGDVAELISDSGARMAFVEAEFVSLVPEGITTVVVGDNYEQWRDGHPRSDPGPDIDPEDEFIQFYTSGTTGLPKGVIIKNRNIAYLCRAGAGWLIDDSSVVAVAMPLFHMGGSAWGLVSLLAGARCVVIADFEPSGYLDTLEAEKVTNILLAPTMLQMLVSVPNVEQRDFSRMRGVAYGAAPITLPLLERVIEVFDAPPIQLFGLTETCGAICQLDPDDHRAELLTSVGKPFEWAELEIHDQDTGEQVATGTTGEVWVRSLQCSDGYWHRPTETAELYAPDGWLRTGDAGHLDEDGYLFLTDRIKDMIITGGENVYPAEVERVLVGHTDIREVAVVGTPDERWGELVTAVVVLEPGAEQTSEALLDWVRPRIAGFRRPRRLEIVETLPRNATGKLLRRDLRSRLSDDGNRADLNP